MSCKTELAEHAFKTRIKCQADYLSALHIIMVSHYEQRGQGEFLVKLSLSMLHLKWRMIELLASCFPVDVLGFIHSD